MGTTSGTLFLGPGAIQQLGQEFLRLPLLLFLVKGMESMWAARAEMVDRVGVRPGGQERSTITLPTVSWPSSSIYPGLQMGDRILWLVTWDARPSECKAMCTNQGVDRGRALVFVFWCLSQNSWVWILMLALGKSPNHFEPHPVQPRIWNLIDSFHLYLHIFIFFWSILLWSILFFFNWSILFFFVVLEMESRASHILSKCSTTVPHPSYFEVF